MAIITLRRSDTCRDCGAELPVGATARYYGPGKVYGTDCHESSKEDRQSRRRPELVRDPGEDQADRFQELQR